MYGFNYIGYAMSEIHYGPLGSNNWRSIPDCYLPLIAAVLNCIIMLISRMKGIGEEDGTKKMLYSLIAIFLFEVPPRVVGMKWMSSE